MDLAPYVVTAFEKVTPDLGSLYRDANGQSLEDWTIKQQAMVTTSGAIAMAVPGAHLVGMAADVAFLMNRMSVCSYGIGAILGRRKLSDNILEAEDFANILALWAGDEAINSLLGSKVASDVATKLGIKVGGKLGAKIIGKSVAQYGSILIGKKLGSKVSAKIAAKFAGKLIGKGLSGFLPFVGMAIGGGINLWFITGIADAAERYYAFKCGLAGKLD